MGNTPGPLGFKDRSAKEGDDLANAYVLLASWRFLGLRHASSALQTYLSRRGRDNPNDAMVFSRSEVDELLDVSGARQLVDLELRNVERALLVRATGRGRCSGPSCEWATQLSFDPALQARYTYDSDTWNHLDEYVNYDESLDWFLTVASFHLQLLVGVVYLPALSDGTPARFDIEAQISVSDTYDYHENMGSLEDSLLRLERRGRARRFEVTGTSSPISRTIPVW